MQATLIKMTTQYSRNVLKVVVAQICQTIGWHSIHTTPLEFMVDLMQEYIFQVAKLSQEYAHVLGRCEVNLDDLGLAFEHMNIDLQELAEYTKNVEPVPCAVSVPKLPIRRESHLNFLKPGSREVITRPVHVHEHLPAMYPGDEEEYVKTEAKETEVTDSSAVNQVANNSEEEISDNNNVVSSNGLSSEESPNKATTQPIFKRPGDPVSFDGPITKRVKLNEEGRPLREIHSVIMTTSGYLSTAREGKLPEARTPQQTRAESPPPPPPPPPPPTYPTASPEVKVEKKLKKIPKKTEDGKPENKENKKKKIPKDTLFQPDEIKEVKVKKLAGTKDTAKLKGLKTGTKAANLNLAGPSNLPVSGKIPGNSPKNAKNNVNKMKIDKSENSLNIDDLMLSERKDEAIDKLPIEPDKQKLNIFKKISSKSKEDKERDSSDTSHKLKDFGSREDLPHLVAEDERHRADSTSKHEDKKLPQNPVLNNNVARASEDNVTNMMSPGSDSYAYDMSPSELRTPSTPKTPELSMPSSIVTFEQKKKKKDKSGKKKESKVKTSKNTVGTKKVRLSNDSISDVNMLDRPKTPQAPEQMQHLMHPSVGTAREQNLPPSLQFPLYPSLPTGPGLLPTGPGVLPYVIPQIAVKKNVPNMQSMPGPPNPAMMPHFFRPMIDGNRPPLVPPSFIGGPHQQQIHQQPLPQPFPTKQLPHQPVQQLNKPKTSSTPDKEMLKSMIQTLHPTSDMSQPLIPNQLPVMSNVATGGPVPVPSAMTHVAPAPLLQPSVAPVVKPPKPEKDKSEKKSKEHKKEKKDKLKKKKEKKEKHKDKGEKIKEKKDKSEKKDKLEKIKEKKEKKEKRKEKELNKKIAKEEKAVESVPKITLKLGPAGGSPRPPTPDNALMKKITIKPPKKPEDEVIKREPTPELARISPLVTRPPKQKSSKKPEGINESYATLPSDASFSSATLTLNSRGPKKPLFKTLPHRESSPSTSFSYTESYGSLKPMDSKQYCFTDASGRTVWICPACGKLDDGSPMIGCDDCDAWYHWVCVGIQVAPAENEDWYCRMCIAKKDEQYQDKKKKKRKKKMKVSA